MIIYDGVEHFFCQLLIHDARINANKQQSPCVLVRDVASYFVDRG